MADNNLQTLRFKQELKLNINRAEGSKVGGTEFWVGP